MSQLRKLQRRQQIGKALGDLSQAASQVSGLSESLKSLPQLLEEVSATRAVLDAIHGDYQTIQAEFLFLRWLLSKKLNLTAEQEAEYRQEFEEETKDSG